MGCGAASQPKAPSRDPSGLRDAAVLELEGQGLGVHPRTGGRFLQARFSPATLIVVRAVF
jgi:hypothetical protein